MRHMIMAGAIWLALLSGGTRAEERIALVIGNGAYSAVSPLANPTADAALMASTLEGLGFNVTLLSDGDYERMKQGISSFGRALRAAGPEATGLFYYAGHGVQSFGSNYLLPVDTLLQDAADLDLVALEASSILRQMFSARNRTNIVILDACRNNPFADIPEFNDNGLAEMKAPTGTYLAYATAPGDVALDGTSGNSPFTNALAESMAVPGMAIDEVFRTVRVAVLEETGGKQTPWSTTSLTAPFVFEPAAVISEEDRVWAAVQENRDVLQVMLFLRQHGGSRHESDARALMAELMAKELGTVPAPPTPAQGTAADTLAAESALIEQAQSTGAVEYYEAYLAQYPSGAFSELARAEVASHQARQAAQAAAPVPDTTEVAAAPAPEAPAKAAVTQEVRFDKPLTQGVPEIVGLTLSEVIVSTPLFPPIEGIPEEMWKGQACSNCHSWSREDLCNQGKFYQDAKAAARSLNGQHPFGGTFKQNLRVWAKEDCP